jgi:spore germination protein
MVIHVVRPGDTLYSVAIQYGVSMSQLLQDNQLPDPSRLVVGQTLVVQFPLETYTVRKGDTLYSIAAAHCMTVSQLLRNNPSLQGEDLIFPGQELILSYHQEKKGAFVVNGYAYPNIERSLLQRTLPYLSQITPFTYRFTAQGTLIPLQDQALVDAAIQSGVRPVFHLSSLTESDGFSTELAHILLTDQLAQTKLMEQMVQTIQKIGYKEVDIDFEYVYKSDAEQYANFIRRLGQLLHPMGIPITVALAPKVSSDQPGALYEGHDYALLSQAADYVLLMTYEWGYLYGPPMAIAPLPNVRQVLDYARTQIPAEKIFLGIPNYGYDWPLPYRQGNKATSISNQFAIELAFRHYAAIRYDEKAQAPWFRYVDDNGQEHEVWFEDARSIQSKLALAQEYGLHGVSYWNLMRPFPQNWVLLNSLYDIR